MLTIEEQVAVRLAKNKANEAAQLAEWAAGQAKCRAKQVQRNAEAEAAYWARWAKAPIITFG